MSARSTATRPPLTSRLSPWRNSPPRRHPRTTSRLLRLPERSQSPTSLRLRYTKPSCVSPTKASPGRTPKPPLEKPTRNARPSPVTNSKSPSKPSSSGSPIEQSSQLKTPLAAQFIAITISSSATACTSSEKSSFRSTIAS
ncbi:hypothetical protein ACFX10_027847 [Malus domestica]